MANLKWPPLDAGGIRRINLMQGACLLREKGQGSVSTDKEKGMTEPMFPEANFLYEAQDLWVPPDLTPQNHILAQSLPPTLSICK